MPASRQTLAGVPVLVVPPAPDAAPGAAPPIVLWFHGFRSEAAANAAELEALASDGFLAVGVDAVGHGARWADDIEARMASTPGGVRAVMLDLAGATVAELPALLAALGARGLGDPARVGVVGVSMGGFMAYRAVQRVRGLRAVVAVLGSPEWGPLEAPAADSPHRELDPFRDVALLSITAERDVNVPPEPARRFHAALARGGAVPERARHLELAGAEHLMAADQWARAMAEAREWLRAHLRPRSPVQTA